MSAGGPIRFQAPSGRPDVAMVEAYARDGFLVLDGFASEDECRALAGRIDELIAAFDPSEFRTAFDTAAQRHGRDAYFRESGDKIRFFFEPEALDLGGRLVRPKVRAINKIGHALHDLDPVFERFSRDPRFGALAGALGPAKPRLIQSMAILKQPFIGDEVGWHQDATYLFTEPQSVTGFWLALEDAGLDNGCLRAIPGGHRGPLRERFRDQGGALKLETLDRTPWPADAGVAIEAPRGTLVVIHGLLPHASGANRTTASRYAYALHAIDADAVYPADNWLKRGALPARGFA